MIVLGIETSCDETAVGIVEDGHILHANAVLSSMDLHKAYGGVVPEIAAREHIRSIHPVIEQAFAEAFPAQRSKLSAQSFFDPWSKIDAIAVTYGAGLGGSLLVGVLTARTLAIIKKKPLYAINHVEAHVYANFITETSGEKLKDGKWYLGSPRSGTSHLSTNYQLPSIPPKFPLLALIVSGGHSQLVLFTDHFNYRLLGQTHDDAIGEAFDKVAKILGLPYPGGPSISSAALRGDPHAFEFPKARMTSIAPGLAELRSKTEDRGLRKLPQSSVLSPQSRNHSYDFSFSGLKTAVLRTAQETIGQDFTFPSHGLSERLSEAQKANIAASFQRVAIETVVDKTMLAFEEFAPKSVVIAGGVASSEELRRQLNSKLSTVNCKLFFTDPRLCTDNGAMIAALGCFKMEHNQPSADPYSLAIAPNLSM